MTTKVTEKLKKITGQTDFPFVSNGVAADDANGFVVNEDALVALVEAAESAETIPALQQTIATANTMLQSATEDLATANGTIATRDARITALEAELVTANASAGTSFQATTRDKDEQGGGGKIPYYASDENPANQLADKLLGKPKAKATV